MYSLKAGSSSDPVMPQRVAGGVLPPASLVLLIVVCLCASFLLPAGFAGWDDLHYVRAAQRWLVEGINLPADHWATRLPYVLAIAAGIRLFGLSDFALMVPNTLLFVVLLLLLWWIGRHVFDARAALCTAFVAAATPLFFRMPTTYYPEVMETVCATGATALTLTALRHSSGRTAAILLLAAGLLGGSGILVRQTSLAVPLALSVLIVLCDRLRPDPSGRGRAAGGRAAGGILLLAVGYAVPLLLEALFYLSMTGNPFERLRIDSRHVLIPSAHLRGGTFTGGSPLFNWSLAARWDVPALIRVHWTVNPLLRVFTYPGLLLTPWLCVAGGLAAWRLHGLPRAYAIFACAAFLGQYLLNTFVLVIAPDTRYFSISVALAIPLAGYLLSRLRRPLLAAAALLLVVPCLLVMALAPAPAHMMPALRDYAARGQPIHISSQLNDAGLLLFAERPDLARNVRLSPDFAATVRLSPDRGGIPVGDLAAVEIYGWPEGSAGARCGDGRQEWQPVDSRAAPGLPWTILDRLGLARLVPGRLANVLDREKDRLSLVRRAC